MLGVKHPLAPNGDALVLVLSLDAPEAPLRVVRVDLGGRGVTALDHDAARGEILVAWNPATPPDAPAAARSRVQRFRVATEEPGAPERLQPVGEPRDVGRADARLEGIALVDGELWLAYDGDSPMIARVAR
jgi:hypothetical protein